MTVQDIETTLAGIEARRAKQARIVRKLQEPAEELERLSQEEAVQRAALASVRAELDQLSAARAEAQRQIDSVKDPAFFARLADDLQIAETYWIEGFAFSYVGIDEYSIRHHIDALRRIATQIDAAHATVARTTEAIDALNGATPQQRAGGDDRPLEPSL